MTQEDLAQATRLDVRTIRNLEKGGNPSLETLSAVCSVLGIEARQAPRPDTSPRRMPYVLTGRAVSLGVETFMLWQARIMLGLWSARLLALLVDPLHAAFPVVVASSWIAVRYFCRMDRRHDAGDPRIGPTTWVETLFMQGSIVVGVPWILGWQGTMAQKGYEPSMAWLGPFTATVVFEAAVAVGVIAWSTLADRDPSTGQTLPGTVARRLAPRRIVAFAGRVVGTIAGRA